MKFAALLLLFSAAASPEIRYFQHQRQVRVSRGPQPQTCVALDPAVFSDAAPQLADLRLYHNGVETPYVIHLAAPVQAKQPSIRPLNLGLRGRDTVFDAAMQTGSYSDLNLDISGENFIATVTVFGSKSKGGPATNIGSYTIFDLIREKLGRSTVLHLPESDFPLLHIQIAGPLKPENVVGLDVDRLPSSQPEFVTVAQSTSGTTKKHQSIYEFTLPANLPVDQLLFTPASTPSSFSRNVTVTVSPIPQKPVTDESEPPHPITASASLLRVHRIEQGHRIDEERLTIDAPVLNFNTPARWTISVDNGDDAPLVLQSVAMQMIERDLCFDAADTNYVLYYGDDALPPPHYDYAALFTPDPAAGKATLDPAQNNPLFQRRPDERAFTEKHPALLWGALLTVVLLLGGIALRSMRHASVE